MFIMRKYLLPILLLSSLFGAKYLAVLDLEPESISESEARILTQRLTSKMIELSDYTVVERASIDKILKEQKFQHFGCADAACAVEIGKLAGVEHMVIGTVSKIGNTYSVDSRMIDVESGKSVISAEYSTQNSIDDVTTQGMELISYQLCNLEVPKPSFFARMYNSRGKIFLACLTLWIGWGLLPA